MTDHARAVGVSLVAAAVMLLLAPTSGRAEQGRGGQAAAAPSPRAVAPIDLTGYWISLVTDDWRWRMMTPPKGDYLYLPLNAEARRVADLWDPAKDEAAREQCRGYGAAAIMRVPGRLHVTWENDTTLRIDTDAGMQTRRFFFGGSPAPSGEPTWQGRSVAQWEFAGGARRGRGEGPYGAAPGVPQRRQGSLKVVTTQMRPGYLRKNGVPYSGNAVLTEYFAVISGAQGEQYLVVTEMLEDPQYLTAPYVKSVQFKKQANASGWDPAPCSAR